MFHKFQIFPNNLISQIIFLSYLLSILFGPLNFFILEQRNFLGINVSITKIFQLTTYFFIFINLIAVKYKCKFQFLIDIVSLHKIFIFFLILSTISTLYHIKNSYIYNPEDLIKEYGSLKFNVIGLILRPYIEILIETHKYIYFVVLAPLVINNLERLIIIFKAFLLVIYLNLVLSFIDYSLTFFDIEIIPRHISDWRHVGYRLHGLFGEPRDAYFGFIFSLSFIFLNQELIHKKKISVYWIVLFTLAIYLTGSTAGFLGSVIFISIISLFFLIKPRVVYSNRYIKIFYLINIILIIFFISFNTRVIFNSHQIIEFLSNFLDSKNIFNIFSYLGELLKNYQKFIENFINLGGDDFNKITHNLKENKPFENIIPYGLNKYEDGLQNYKQNFISLILISERISNLEIWSLLIGSGSNSISFYLNNYLQLNEITNSQSKFINIIFNYGFLGAFMFYYCFWSLLKRSIIDKNSILRNQQLGLFIIIFLSNLIHDNLFLYLITGLILAHNSVSNDIQRYKL